MNTIRQCLITILLSSAGLTAQAHLVHEQTGTVNLTGNGAFVVVSLPVSAFSGVDDNKDGRLSPKEFARHRAAISSQIEAGFFLSDKDRQFRMNGILLSLALAHETAQDSAAQVIALGRINTKDARRPLTIHTTLFGKDPKEKTLRLRVSRNKQNHRKITLTPTQSTRFLGK